MNSRSKDEEQKVTFNNNKYDFDRVISFLAVSDVKNLSSVSSGFFSKVTNNFITKGKKIIAAYDEGGFICFGKTKILCNTLLPRELHTLNGYYALGKNLLTVKQGANLRLLKENRLKWLLTPSGLAALEEGLVCPEKLRDLASDGRTEVLLSPPGVAALRNNLITYESVRSRPMMDASQLLAFQAEVEALVNQVNLPNKKL